MVAPARARLRPAEQRRTSPVDTTLPGAPSCSGLSRSRLKVYRQEMQRNRASRSPTPDTQKGRPLVRRRARPSTFSGIHTWQRGSLASRGGALQGCHGKIRRHLEQGAAVHPALVDPVHELEHRLGQALGPDLLLLRVAGEPDAGRAP